MLDNVLNTLKQQQDTLKEYGVLHASVFGSMASGQYTAGSDIDILIDLDEGKPITVFDYAAIKDMIGNMFNAPVDVVTRKGLKTSIRDRVEKEAVDAF